MKQSFILFIIFGILNFTCQKTFILKTEEEVKPTILSLIKNNDTIKINLFYSIPVSSLLDSFTPINNGKIYIFENNKLKDSILKGSNGLYISKLIAKENTFYSLKVKVENFDTLYAQTYIPKEIKLDSFSYIFIPEISAFRVSFILKDIYEEKNFYQLYINSFGLPCWSAHPLLKYSYYNINNFDFLIFSDISFNQTQVKLYFNNTKEAYSDTTETEIIIRHLSYDAYEHYRTLLIQFYQQTDDLNFSDPIKIYNNVKNGYGIFAGFFEKKYLLKMTSK